MFARVQRQRPAGAVEDMLDRRHVALPAVATFVTARIGGFRARNRRCVSGRGCARLLAALAASLGVARLRPDRAPEFRWLHADLTSPGRVLQRRRWRGFSSCGAARALFPDRKGTAEARSRVQGVHFTSKAAKDQHETRSVALAPDIKDALEALERPSTPCSHAAFFACCASHRLV